MVDHQYRKKLDEKSFVHVAANLHDFVEYRLTLNGTTLKLEQVYFNTHKEVLTHTFNNNHSNIQLSSVLNKPTSSEI